MDLEFLKSLISIPLGVGTALGIAFIQKQPKDSWAKSHPFISTLAIAVFFSLAGAIADIIKWKEALLQTGLTYLIAHLFSEYIIARFTKKKVEAKDGCAEEAK